MTPKDVIPGFEAFALGYIGEPLAWLANPAFLVALQLQRRRRFGWSAAVAFIGALLAYTVILPIWYPDEPLCIGDPTVCYGSLQLCGFYADQVMIGYWLWAIAPVILLVAALISLLLRKRSTKFAADSTGSG